MNRYSVFGGCLRSELEFPELPEAVDDRVDWTFTISDTPPADPPTEALGRDRVDDPIEVRSFRTEGGFRLEYDDTGTFDVLRAGKEIVWYRPPDASDEAARLDVIGRVLALALHASGSFCLHASAVAIAGGAVGFIAPKFHGKSTLALALAGAGGRLITDDTLAVDLVPTPSARPGIQTVRLWEDSAAAVGLGQGSVVVEGSGKYRVHDRPRLRPVRRKAPLVALYALAPKTPVPGEPAAQRTLLPPTRAVLALVGQSKLGPLLGGSEGPVHFRRAAALAGTVPVYTLEVVRDLDRLDDVVDTVLEWHHGRVTEAVGK